MNNTSLTASYARAERSQYREAAREEQRTRATLFELCAICDEPVLATTTNRLADGSYAHPAGCCAVLRVIARDRREDETCERLTAGCCIDHAKDAGSCETW